MDSNTKKKIQGVSDDAQQEMVARLHKLCEINSGTRHLNGLNSVLNSLKSFYKPYADTIQCYSFPSIPLLDMKGNIKSLQCGDALFIQKRPWLSRRILLCGHMDTVFPEHSSFQELHYLDENTLNGPGVCDMKGGLVVMHQALLNFEGFKEANSLGIDILINADEEIGSIASKSLYPVLVPNYKAALVYEPTMNSAGEIAKNRRGTTKVTLLAKGKAAHAGREFEKGRNAICYLAEVLLAIHALNGQRPGLSINIGKIRGGTALNVVPDIAVAKLDVRYTHSEDQLWLSQKLKEIQERFFREGYALKVEEHSGRPPKMVNSNTIKLFSRLKEMAKCLNLELTWSDSGGCCDGNDLAAYGLPVLDTLGVRGGNIHSHDEYILLDSLVERASLSTLLLLDLAKGSLETLG